MLVNNWLFGVEKGPVFGVFFFMLSCFSCHFSFWRLSPLLIQCLLLFTVGEKKTLLVKKKSIHNGHGKSITSCMI